MEKVILDEIKAPKLFNIDKIMIMIKICYKNSIVRLMLIYRNNQKL